MSLRGQINKVNRDFFDAVKKASMRGTVDAEGGTYGTRKITGYVCEVHGIDDENENLRGTVDVQEYGYEPGEDKYEGAGHHAGVLCSSIQPNKNGIFIMPALYSDVVITQDPISLDEYILMCSHVDVIQMRSRSSAHIGVVETEAFKESEDDDDDSPDMDDLKETGNAAYTNYNKDGITHTVKNKDGEIIIKQLAGQVEIEAKDTTVTISTKGEVTISAKNVNIASTSALKTSSPSTIIDGSNVEVTGGSFVRRGKANLDGQGGFCGIAVCPFTGAIHTGSTIVGG